jgi:hypothetical protein
MLLHQKFFNGYSIFTPDKTDTEEMEKMGNYTIYSFPIFRNFTLWFNSESPHWMRSSPTRPFPSEGRRNPSVG